MSYIYSGGKVDKSMHPEPEEGEIKRALEDNESSTVGKSQKIAFKSGISSGKDGSRIYKIGRQKIPKANVFIRFFSSIKNAFQDFIVKRQVARLNDDEIADKIWKINEKIDAIADANIQKFAEGVFVEPKISVHQSIHIKGNRAVKENILKFDESFKVFDQYIESPELLDEDEKSDLKAILKDLKKDLKLLKYYERRIDDTTHKMHVENQNNPIDQDHIGLGPRQLDDLQLEDTYKDRIANFKQNQMDRYNVRNLQSAISDKVSYLEVILNSSFSKLKVEDAIEVRIYNFEDDTTVPLNPNDRYLNVEVGGSPRKNSLLRRNPEDISLQDHLKDKGLEIEEKSQTYGDLSDVKEVSFEDIFNATKVFIKNKNYGSFIAAELDKTLQNDSPVDLKDLKAKFMKNIENDRSKVEFLDRETFADLYEKEGMVSGDVPYNILVAYEYETLKNLFENGHWKDGESYKITTHNISVKDNAEAEKRIDEMLEDLDFQKLLTQFIKVNREDEKRLNGAIVTEIEELSIPIDVANVLKENVDVIRKGGDLHILLDDLINNTKDFNSPITKDIVIEFLRRYGFIDLNS